MTARSMDDPPPTPPKRGASVRPRRVRFPSWEGLRGGFMVPMHAQIAKGALHKAARGIESQPALGKRRLKTHSLQTPTRGPLTRPEARSVWTASDLSALSVRRGTASGSWPHCTISESSERSTHRLFPSANFCCYMQQKFVVPVQGPNACENERGFHDRQACQAAARRC